jgi:hypothetical protein
MNNTNIFKSIILAAFPISFTLSAKEISIVPSTTIQTNFDAKYPAAYFQPKVIFLSETSGESSTAAPQNTTDQAEMDLRYPAANFQPKIIFSSDMTISSSNTAKP